MSSPTKATGDVTPSDLYTAFLKGVFLVTAAAWLLLALPLYWIGEAAIVWGVLVGCFLPALCFVVGFSSMCRNFHRPLNKLMMAFFGGMLARMLVIGLAFFLLLLFTQMHVASLLASLCGFYFLYLTLELYFVNGRFKDIQEPS